eukprot:613020-Pyramimonas_sp.AAC.1
MSEQSSHGPRRHADAISTGELGKTFHVVEEEFRKSQGKSWLVRTKGSISAMLLWLQEAGWSWESPAVFVSASGQRFVMTESPPQAVAE